MTTTDGTFTRYIGIPDIAQIAGVTRTAVSNWRTRHGDFPSPVISTPSGVLFDLASIESWLIAKGKIAGPLTAGQNLWFALDGLLSGLVAQEIGAFVNAALVHREVSSRASRGDVPALRAGHLFSEVIARDGPDLFAALRDAAIVIEATHHDLEGLIVDGYNLREVVSPSAVAEVLHLIDQATQRDLSSIEIFERVTERVHDVDWLTANYATADSLELLFAHLSATAPRIFDPCCGEAGALLRAYKFRAEGEPTPVLYGCDTNKEAIIIARTRCYLSGIEAHLQVSDSLRSRAQVKDIDVVILEPPKDPFPRADADGEIYASKHWQYGTPPPPPHPTDTAWLQIALETLSPGGRAFVALPGWSLSTTGQAAEIRENLIAAGVVESVVLLPQRFATHGNVRQLALWCLRSPTARPPRPKLLLVDATELGKSGRRGVALAEQEVVSLARLLRTWSDSGKVVNTDKKISVHAVNAAELFESNLNPKFYPQDGGKRYLTIGDVADVLKDNNEQTPPESLIQAVSLFGGPRGSLDEGSYPGVLRGAPIGVDVEDRPGVVRIQEGDILLTVVTAYGLHIRIAVADQIGQRASGYAVVRIRPGETRIVPEWLYTSINSEPIRSLLSAVGVSKGNANLNKKAFERITLPIPLPPVPVQRILTVHLKMIDASIKRYQQVVEALTEQRLKAIERFQGPDKNP